MQLTPRATLLQFAHVLQQELFPRLAEATGPLSPAQQLLAAVSALVPFDRHLKRRARTGRPARDRLALATAFVAKAIFNLPTTRDLIERLQADQALRRLCGWARVQAIPHESKFSRAFAEFAVGELPQQAHAAVVQVTQGPRLIGHIARDSTAIPARERFAAPDKNGRRSKKRKAGGGEAKAKRGRKKGASGPFPRAKASERGTRIERQRHQDLPAMLAELPRQCDIGVKKSSQGYQQYWRGYKLHWDVADGQIPISAVLTSASLHDSQVAIPLMRMSTQRVQYLYDLMDSAYDADDLHAESRKLQHVPIIAPHSRRGSKRESPLKKVFPMRPAPQLTWAQEDRFRERTMVERVNGRLKDEFGGSQIRVRGAAKVMAHLMFGVLALTVDQWLRIAANQT